MPININGTTGISGVDGSAGTPSIQGSDTNTGVFFPAADTAAIATGGTERMRIDSSGNVGIGTISPTARLQVREDQNGTTRAIIQNRNGSGTPISEVAFISGAFDLSDNRYAYIQSGGGSSTYLAFGTGNGATPTERARIDTSGNLLVNTTTRTGGERMALWYSSNSGPGLNIRDTNAQNGNTFIQFNNGTTTAGAITSNGTTTMTYGSGSDYRLKKDIVPLTGALAKISSLQPKFGKWKVDGSDFIGFIAHELQDVFPDAVVGEKDKVDGEGNPQYQMVDTGSASIIATLVAAIQELNAKVEAQAAEIAILKGAA